MIYDIAPIRILLKTKERNDAAKFEERQAKREALDSAREAKATVSSKGTVSKSIKAEEELRLRLAQEEQVRSNVNSKFGLGAIRLYSMLI